MRKDSETKLGKDPYLIGITSRLLYKEIDNLTVKWKKIRRRVKNDFAWEEIKQDEQEKINERVKKTLKIALVPALIPTSDLSSSLLNESLFSEYEQRKDDLRKELKEIVRNSTSNRDDHTLALVHLDGGMVNTVLGEYEKAINDIHFETVLWANESLKNKEFDLIANYFLVICNYHVFMEKKGNEKIAYYKNVISRSDKVLMTASDIETNEINQPNEYFYKLCAKKVKEYKYKVETEITKVEFRDSYSESEEESKKPEVTPTVGYSERLEYVAKEVLTGLHKKEYRDELKGLGHLRDEVIKLARRELLNVFEEGDPEELIIKLEQLLDRVLEIAPEELSEVHRKARDGELSKLKHLLNKELSSEEVKSTISSDPRLGILLGNVYRKIGNTEDAVKTYLFTLDLTTGDTLKRVYDPFRVVKEASVKTVKKTSKTF